jgi:hypothetical protein
VCVCVCVCVCIYPSVGVGFSSLLLDLASTGGWIEFWSWVVGSDVFLRGAEQMRLVDCFRRTLESIPSTFHTSAKLPSGNCAVKQLPCSMPYTSVRSHVPILLQRAL